MAYETPLKRVFEEIKNQPDKGKIASYIPELLKVDPQHFGVHLRSAHGEICGAGDYETPFSVQSIAKVFSLSMAYDLCGCHLWDRLDVEPSGNPFNSLVQLENDRGVPRNPFINAGALVICDILISRLRHPKREFLNYVRKLGDLPSIDYDLAVAASERSVAYGNNALANYIKSFGNLENKVSEVLDFYFHLCSISMNCSQLTQTFLYLVNQGKKMDGTPLLQPNLVKRINAIMQTCGFYDEAGEFAYRVGLPGKSGVGGGIVAVHPGKYVIAVWSPKLNAKGNSYRGLEFLEAFTTATNSSIF